MKKSVSVFAVMVLIITTCCISFANDGKDNFSKELFRLEKLYDVEISVDYPNSIDERISLNSISELESHLINFKEDVSTYTASMETTEYIQVSNAKANDEPERSIYTWSWWAPFSGFSGLGGPAEPLLTWRHIEHVHEYEKKNGIPYFTKCEDIKSYVTGLNVGTGWRHTSGGYKITTTNNYHDTISNTVRGYWFMGVDIEGVPVNIKQMETWPTRKLVIK